MATTDKTASTGTSKADVLALVEEHDIQFIRLWFTDILGRLKSFAVGKAETSRARSRKGWASTARRSPASTGSRSRT